VIEFNDNVVDADTDERSQQMFNGFDGRTVPAEDGRVMKRCHVLHGRRNLDPQICTTKYNTGIGGRRLERQRNFIAGVEADSGAGNLAANSALRVHSVVGSGFTALAPPAKTMPGTQTFYGTT
jgi:hypothetical protein